MGRKKKNELSLNFKVERSNELNRMYPKGMTLTEIRFLAIYQARINARQPETRTVIFQLSEFCRIMEIKELNIEYMKSVADNIICKPVHLPSTSGKNGFIAIPLFNECEVYQDNDTLAWFVKIKCHEKALPYIFNMKRNYFSYELWNALKLKSINQVRMYEILKQYEKIGERVIKIEELKYMLGLSINKYKLFSDFRREVLEVCQKSLEEHTDIKYTYETIKGAKGKVLSIKFNIEKNPNFVDDLRLKEFIKPEDLADISEEIPVKIEKFKEKPVEKEKVELGFNFDNSYLPEQLENLFDIAKSISDKPEAYLKSIYYQIKARNKNISNLYNYTLSIINADLKNVSATSSKPKKESEKPKKESSILDGYDPLWFLNMRTEPFETTQEIEFDSDRYFRYNIKQILQEKFNIYDGTIYDYKELNDLIKYIYDKYNVLLIDTNTNAE